LEQKKDVSELQARKELRESPFTDGETVPGNEATEGGADNTTPDDAIVGRKLTRFRMVLLLSTALCLLLAAACFFFIKFKDQILFFANGLQKIRPATSIMRPIPLPDYREMLDFVLVYEIDGQKMITAIRMEIEYQSSMRYQNFKEQNVVFRDTVYTFLLKQNLSGNSVKSWHSVLEKDLIDYLRVKLPQSYPDKILLTQVENL
jgi:hypothetical protein